jgi:hypothetical protein
MTERCHRAPYPLFALLLAPVAAPPQEGGGALRVPLRVEGPVLHLAEHLASARIASPLNGLQPARDLEDLDEPDTDLLLDEGFEEFDWDFAGWRRVPGVEVVAEGEGQVLHLEAPTDAFLGWVLPVRPDAFYRFERSIRVQGEPFCDLCVVESRDEPEQGVRDARAHFLAGRGSALKIHPLPIQPPEGVWQRAGTSFYPTPRTRSLVVLVRPRVGADPNATVRGTSFDRIRLEEISPTRAERMRLLMGASADPAAGAEGALRKAGLLLPLPSPEGVQLAHRRMARSTKLAWASIP